MSMEYTACALAVGPDVRSDRLLLLALCDRADENGVCWPSRADLRERASMSDATLTRSLRRLEAGGWVHRQRRFNTSNVFRVNVARLRERYAALRAKPRVSAEFEPFPEERAAQSQVVENKGSAHGEQGSAHGEQGSAHCAAPNLSRTNQEPKKAGEIRTGRKTGSAGGLTLAGLSRFARACLAEGRAVPLGDGRSLAVGSPAYLALEAEALRERRAG